jgi:hypothetical protein
METDVRRIEAKQLFAWQVRKILKKKYFQDVRNKIGFAV